MGTCPRRSGPAHVVAALALLLVPAATTSLAADVSPAGWYAGDPHVHRSCGGPPENVSSLYNKMAVNNLAAISLLADMGNGEVQDPDTDLPLVTGLDDPDYSDRIVHWDAEWHWDPVYTQYPHLALGGHVIALGLTGAEQVWQEYTQPIFQWVTTRNGIGGFAHMQYLSDTPPSTLDCCTPLEYPVEVALGSPTPFISEDVTGSESAIRAYYRLLNTGFRPGLAAGTDYPCGVSELGSLLTYVEVADGVMTYPNWIEGIAAGRTVVSRNGHKEFLGLTVNGTATPGDQIDLTEGGAVSVNVEWSATQSLYGTIELVRDGTVVATLQTSAGPGAPATLSTTVNFPRSGWLAARRMDGTGHQVHTAAVFVIVNGAPIRASVADAQFFVDWIDNLLTRTAVGGDWRTYLPTQSVQARARYQAAKTRFQQIAAEAAAEPPSVTAVAPLDGATNVPVGTTVTATFSEPLDPNAVSTSTVELRDGGVTVPAAVTWNAATLSIVLRPLSALAYSTPYTATVKGGSGGVTDVGGTPLADDVTWTFTTGTVQSVARSLWENSDAPAGFWNDGNALEVGVRFRSSLAGWITHLRFYKSVGDAGTHVGHLWSSTGTLLATASFAGETASGWQEVALLSAVPITANTTYVASYHSSQGDYGATEDYFKQAFANYPLTALADGTDGPNGVYKYGAPGFPTSSYASANYWVDVVFSTEPPGPDNVRPTVVATTPSNGASGVPVDTNASARFSEALAPATVTGSTVQLRDAAAQLVPASVTWDPATRSAVLDPTAALDYSGTYTVTVKGGASGVTDVAGNPLDADYPWTFTTQAAPPPPPEEGPGGPLLVIGYSGNPFSRYYAEILRAEGLNEFKAMDISAVDATVLARYDVAILGEMPLTTAQATMLDEWVNDGGNLIAMRPALQLAALLGLTPSGTTLAEGYVAVDTSRAPGMGIVSDTIQFHGTADRYTLAAATPPAVAVATLYSNATTATTSPAVTLRSVGAAGGEVAAFTFDLARSIVYTRQGNPAWVGDERDGTSPLRSDDLFYGNKSGDPQPDWVNLAKVAIPQADEQQRLLANLILKMNADRKPLPRFWYFPRGRKAVVIMAVDNHGGESVETRFAAEEAASPAGCSVQDWECVRSTVYLYTGGLSDDATAKQWEDAGFEVALHVNTNCANWTPSSLAGFFTEQITDFFSTYSSLSPLQSHRTHCIAWSDWATQPKVELANGIRLDTNYYYWPPTWVANRPGFMTGSGIPMRFADVDGSMIDVYQATTQMTDESGQTYPFTINTLLDRATGSQGYYGAFTANIHADGSTESQAAAIVASAKAWSVPVVSAKQMLTWLDGRNGSSFEDISWSAGTLTFGISVAAGANGLQAMLPTAAAGSPLIALTRGGVTVPFTRQTVKGVEYAVFVADPGTYAAAYTSDTTAPAISSVSVVVGTNGTAAVQWATDEPSSSVVRYGTSPGSLLLTASSPILVTAHSIQLTGLAAGTTYYYDVTSVDAAGNSASSAVGSFATTADATPPTVSLVAPVGGERLYTGSPYLIRWTATDNVGVTSIDVAFSSDGGTSYAAVAGCSGLSGTAQSCTWAAPGPATTQGRIRVTARDAAGQTGTATSGANFTVVSGTPSLTLTAPNTAVSWAIGSTQAITFDHNLGTGATVVIDLSRDGGATWSSLSPGFVTTSATTGSFGWLVTGPATTAARARVTWAANPAVTGTSAANFTIADTTAPTVAVTAPATGSTVSGTVTVSATASDNVAVAGVQFLLDGALLGAEDTTSPYSVAWNTTTATAGSHTLTARARDAAGNQTTSAAVSVTVASVSTGLVAAYGFEEGSGTTTTDASGLGNTGTITAGTWATTGRFGKALSFNGTSSLVTINDTAALRLTSAMTLEAWVRPTASASWRCAVLKETSGGLAYGLYASDTSSRPGGFLRIGSEVDATAPSAITLNAWTHLAATYDGATLRLFVNGTQVTSRALTGTIVSSTQPLRIGGNQVWGEYFAGLIDEVRVYNRALSAAEIQTDMNTPVSP